MNRARVLRLAREMLAEQETSRVALRNDSGTPGFTQKVPADHPDYKARVAEPTMAAVDQLPAAYRDCVKSYDYVDVYRAWLRHWPVARIRETAERLGGRFVL